MTNGSLILHRPLLAFDLETTGLDVNTDRIVEISCVRIEVDGTRKVYTRRINPQMPISNSATAVHGISDADVADQPPFVAIAAELFELFQGCDLTGFNIEQFDLPLLSREFSRCHLNFTTSQAQIVDSWRIFLRKEPRDLSAAYKFYCGKTLQGAHGAEADAMAAADILLAQVQRYEDLPKNVGDLHQFCHEKNREWLDPDGKIVWREDKAVLSFGKYKNKPLDVLVSEDPDYLRWVASSNFSDTVIGIIKAALEGEMPKRV